MSYTRFVFRGPRDFNVDMNRLKRTDTPIQLDHTLNEEVFGSIIPKCKSRLDSLSRAGLNGLPNNGTNQRLHAESK